MASRLNEPSAEACQSVRANCQRAWYADRPTRINTHLVLGVVWLRHRWVYCGDETYGWDADGDSSESKRQGSQAYERKRQGSRAWSCKRKRNADEACWANCNVDCIRKTQHRLTSCNSGSGVSSPFDLGLSTVVHTRLPQSVRPHQQNSFVSWLAYDRVLPFRVPPRRPAEGSDRERCGFQPRCLPATVFPRRLDKSRIITGCGCCTSAPVSTVDYNCGLLMHTPI